MIKRVKAKDVKVGDLVVVDFFGASKDEVCDLIISMELLLTGVKFNVLRIDGDIVKTKTWTASRFRVIRVIR